MPSSCHLASQRDRSSLARVAFSHYRDSFLCRTLPCWTGRRVASSSWIPESISSAFYPSNPPHGERVSPFTSASPACQSGNDMNQLPLRAKIIVAAFTWERDFERLCIHPLPPPAATERHGEGRRLGGGRWKQCNLC